MRKEAKQSKKGPPIAKCDVPFQKHVSLVPVDIWEKIISQACSPFHPQGVRGLSVVSRELCQLSLVCKEFHLAVSLSFQRLAAILDHQDQSPETNDMVKQKGKITDQPGSKSKLNNGSRQLSLACAKVQKAVELEKQPKGPLWTQLYEKFTPRKSSISYLLEKGRTEYVYVRIEPKKEFFKFPMPHLSDFEIRRAYLMRKRIVKRLAWESFEELPMRAPAVLGTIHKVREARLDRLIKERKERI